jgi:hypothetical protein
MIESSGTPIPFSTQLLGMHNKMIFIGGMGRSGTHYLGRTLGEHPDITLRLESKFTFWSITNHVAHNQKTHSLRFWLSAIFLKCLTIGSSKVICEKTHPAIWIKAKLSFLFPNAKWICVVRDPYQAVASMKKHAGVQKWYQKLPLDEVNPFLGITEENKQNFNRLSLAEKGAYKWISHTQQMEKIQRESPENVLLVNFNDLVTSQEKTLKLALNFLGLSTHTPMEKGEQSTLHKKQALTKEEALSISQILIANNYGQWTSHSPYFEVESNSE